MNVPEGLLEAISAAGGGRVALVIGAGCSVEAPTSIPLAGPLAIEAERRLVLDGVLTPGQCEAPSNLAALASLVFSQTGSQEALVSRFPLDKMRVVKPNAGYRQLVALMAEGAISHVLSLNFDLAVEHAASELASDIVIIRRPDQLVPARATLVYLHGDANSSADELVLREETIDADWRGRWQQIVAQQILSAPTILFAGLGSAAPVLSATIAMIEDALGGAKTIYQADTAAHADNVFAKQLDVPEDRYVRASWSEVLSALAERVAAEQVHALKVNGDAILLENQASDAERKQFAALAGCLASLPLLALGKLRAFARLDPNRFYAPHCVDDDQMIAEPMLRLAHMCEEFGFEAEPARSGTWTLRRNGHVAAQLVLATGRGVRRLEALAPRARQVCDYIAEHGATGPDFVLVGGVLRDNAALAHTDIICDDDPADLIAGPIAPLVISADDPDFVGRIGEMLNAA